MPNSYPTAKHRPRPFSLKIRSKIRLLKAARILKHGGMIGHSTATLPGVAVSPVCKIAMQRMARFKQRGGPFLLIADSLRSVYRLAVHVPLALRRNMQRAWPGATTFVLPARPTKKTGLAADCYQQRRIAVRIDADAECRFLATRIGGLMASSSLNRKGQTVQKPNRRLRMRLHRHLDAAIRGENGSGHASAILQWRSNRLHVLRSGSNHGK
ncbi:MAG: Sua5/YciO/YrdC/YwlC family protein [Mariprofundaceae bacterium]